MASAKVALSTASEEIQCEHRELMDRLLELDRALECLICYSEVFADLKGVECAQQTARWLAGWLPVHFMHEEQGILATVSRLGPEFAAFAREMKQQHKEIHARVESFLRVAGSFNDTPDLQQSMCDLKEEGKALATFMAAHMGAEERKYAVLK